MKNKGLSEVVSVVVIILISIMAITILAAVVFKIANSPKLSPEYSCLDLKIKNVASVESACYNQNTKDLEIKIKRNLAEQQISNIEFITDNNHFVCGDFCSSCKILSQESAQKYYIYTENKPAEVSIKINNCLISTKEIELC
ncbi:MAG: hypothetical protein AABY22_02000 [Nanoarchaeota archaeon]